MKRVTEKGKQVNEPKKVYCALTGELCILPNQKECSGCPEQGT